MVILRCLHRDYPREIDEAAIVDGASPLRLFFLGYPATHFRLSDCDYYRDFFQLPFYNRLFQSLYFLPGTKNVTAQLTLFSLWPVQFAVELSICGCGSHHYPAIDRIYVLPKANCVWHDHWLGER